VAPELASSCEKGFITSSLIARRSDVSRDSFFLCGPAAMYDFVVPELRTLGVPRRRIRQEAYGEIEDPAAFDSYPREAVGKLFSIALRRGSESLSVPALAAESVLTALERAGLSPPSSCRSGECQCCRALLIAGEVWTGERCDGRRMADRQRGFIHPCASFPLSDLELELPSSDDRRG
jgi:ferredoxin